MAANEGNLNPENMGKILAALKDENLDYNSRDGEITI